MQGSNFTDWSEKLVASSRLGAKTAHLCARRFSRGFVFSLDAFVAVFMVTTALFLFLNIAGTNSISSAQSATVIDDTVFALEKTGFLIQTLDSNTVSNSASLIRQELVGYLPSGFDANVSVTSYLIDKEQCALSQTFEACFPDANKLTGSSGGFTEENFISGRKYFIMKERPGDCNVLAEFSAFDPFEGSAIDWIPEKKVEAGALFSEAFFSHGGLHIDFNVTVNPNDSVTCDENVSITLTATVDGSLRKPVDIIIVLDASMPTNEFAIEQNVMVNFVQNALWDTDDQIGAAAYDNVGIKRKPLQSTDNMTDVINSINNLVRNNNPNHNAIGKGLEQGLDYLDPNIPASENKINPDAEHFLVILTNHADTTNPGSLLATQTTRAVSLGVTVFTVGVGFDSNELEAVASGTGGEYYFAADINALEGVYQIIANRITEFANDSSVSVPTIDGVDIIDLGGGILSDTNIVFDSGSLEPGVPWTATYTLNFPCNNANICGIDALTFPGTGTFLTYTDSNGVTHDVDFNSSTTLDFRVRDLEVEITGGEVIGTNDISIDVLVENTGELDANSVPLRFYFEDPSPPIVEELVVPSLCSIETPGCTEFSKTFSGVNLNQEGRVYATINDDNSIRECPLGNEDNILCSGGPRTEVFVVDYTVWRN